jgi:flagellar motor switch protein FliN/FliY
MSLNEPFRQVAGIWMDAWRDSLASMLNQQPALSGPEAVPSGDISADIQWFLIHLNVPECSFRVGADREAWMKLGRAALESAGLTDATPEDCLGTSKEIIAQSASIVARSLSSALSRDITAQLPQEIVEQHRMPTTDICYRSVLKLDESVTFIFSANRALAHLIQAAEPPAGAQLQAPGSDYELPKSRTFDLLLEVELPVSVSFGRAQLPLRDVLKLNSGSIVELNRTILEPVEIIVNNCVIARGEVVVVEGNYGVRIHEVISREERLRTLY